MLNTEGTVGFKSDMKNSSSQNVKMLACDSAKSFTLFYREEKLLLLHLKEIYCNLHLD